MDAARLECYAAAMSDVDTECLDRFPGWLDSLARDAGALSLVLEDPDEPEGARRSAACALNYLFKSVDLVPDGIQDLGFLDDAFVFRVAAEGARAGGGSAEVLVRLASDAGLVRLFLDGDYESLARFVSSLGKEPVRGRTVDDLLSDAGLRTALLGEVRGWAESYITPSFGRDTKNLVKLRAFLKKRLAAREV